MSSRIVRYLLERLAALENLGAVVGIGEGKAVRWVATGQAQEHDDDVITSAPELVPNRRRRGRERPEPRRYSIASR